MYRFLLLLILAVCHGQAPDARIEEIAGRIQEVHNLLGDFNRQESVIEQDAAIQAQSMEEQHITRQRDLEIQKQNNNDLILALQAQITQIRNTPLLFDPTQQLESLNAQIAEIRTKQEQLQTQSRVEQLEWNQTALNEQRRLQELKAQVRADRDELREQLASLQQELADWQRLKNSQDAEQERAARLTNPTPLPSPSALLSPSP